MNLIKQESILDTLQFYDSMINVVKRDKRSSYLCQYQDKGDIFLRTDIKFSGGPLLGLKHCIKRENSTRISVNIRIGILYSSHKSF